MLQSYQGGMLSLIGPHWQPPVAALFHDFLQIKPCDLIDEMSALLTILSMMRETAKASLMSLLLERFYHGPTL